MNNGSKKKIRIGLNGIIEFFGLSIINELKQCVVVSWHSPGGSLKCDISGQTQYVWLPSIGFIM